MSLCARAVGLLLCVACAGCTAELRTGDAAFAGLVTGAELDRLGAQGHAQLLHDHGLVPSAEVQGYVADIGRRVAAASAWPQDRFVWHALDSGEPNAFALPGGHVYVTRGLLAFSDSEAELAAVLAHEIAHLTEGHPAARYGQALLAEMGAAALQLALGPEMAELSAALYFSNYTREQEAEADRVGLATMQRAGYDGRAMASLLGRIEAWGRLDANAGRREGGLLSTHAPPSERAAIASRVTAVGGRIGRDEHLSMLDGLAWGDSARTGFLHGRNFVHPELGFAFEPPDGFRLINRPDTVIMRGARGATIVFDQDLRPFTGSMRDYLRSAWIGEPRLSPPDELRIGGMDAASAATRLPNSGTLTELRVVAVRFDDQRVFRFLLLSRTGEQAAIDELFRRTALSLRRLAPTERQGLRPSRIALARLDQSETLADLARRVGIPADRLEKLRVLNGLPPDARPAPGTLIKLIVE